MSFLKVPKGGFEGLRGPLAPSLSPTPPPLDGGFLEPGSPAENGWFCRLIGLPIGGIR